MKGWNLPKWEILTYLGRGQWENFLWGNELFVNHKLRFLGVRIVGLYRAFNFLKSLLYHIGRVHLKTDGTRWRTGGKWRGNCRMEWVTSTLHTTSEHVVSSITIAESHTSVVDWTDAPADLNGLVRFAERPNLISAHVPSHFKRSLPIFNYVYTNSPCKLKYSSYCGANFGFAFFAKGHRQAFQPIL